MLFFKKNIDCQFLIPTWLTCDQPLLQFQLLNAFHPMSVSFVEPFINLPKLTHRSIVRGGCWLYLIRSYCSCKVSAVQHKVPFRLNLHLPKSMRSTMIMQVWRHSRIERGKMLVRERCAEMKLRGTWTCCNGESVRKAQAFPDFS